LNWKISINKIWILLTSFEKNAMELSVIELTTIRNHRLPQSLSQPVIIIFVFPRQPSTHLISINGTAAALEAKNTFCEKS
jgi:hypothetical protein